MTILEFAKDTIRELSICKEGDWATIFVNRRISFHQQFSKGLIFSIAHGSDFFENVCRCLEDNMIWEEKGEYGDNFRKLIKMYK